jgi:hypothetical protein
MKNVMIAVTVLLALSGALVWGQDAQPQAAAQATAQAPAQDPFELMKQEAEKQFSFSAYAAVAKEDANLLKSGESRYIAGDLLPWRYVGEGRCDQPGDWPERELCWAVKGKDCSTATDPVAKKACEVILSGNPGDVDGFYAVSRKQYPDTGRDEIMMALAIIRGYLLQSSAECQRYLDAYAPVIGEENRFCGCRIIFAQDPVAEAEKVAAEVTYFDMAKEDRSLCEKIIDSQLKKTCQSR